ncbi:MAG: hypothetical protein HY704_07455 [Gemmatimonadetes bacterium]|nr:hypothetical protein [Gemmatimonadota bacterium]
MSPGRRTRDRSEAVARGQGGARPPIRTAALGGRALLLLGLLTGCGIVDTGLEVDGYGAVQGTVVRAGGAAYAKGEIALDCPPAILGLRSPTDDRGFYRFQLVLPSPLGESLSSDGTLACRVQAQGISALAQAAVRFWPREELVVPTVLNLTEGTGT